MAQRVWRAGHWGGMTKKRIDVLLVERGVFESRSKARAAIEAGGTLWIEAVKRRTRPVATTDSGNLAELRDVFFAGLGDPDIVAKLRDEFDSLRQKVPDPARADLDLQTDEDGLRRLAEEAWQLAAGAIAATDQR